jgi:hypothetical protein
VLLVGDARNINHDRHGEETILPFMPVDGNSGEYLLGALPDLTWRTAGIVNGAEDVDLAELRLALESPRVVALGKSAAKSLVDQGITDFAELPHPQYVRRFHNKRAKEYGQAIVAAANGEVNSEWTQ